MLRFSILGFIIGCLSLAGFSQRDTIPKYALDKISLQDVPADAPGIATAILKKGKLVYAQYGGYADLGSKRLIGPETRFNFASNGKQFTALAILTLEQEKKLQLSDDVRKYLPSLLPDIKASIQIKHLLNHTSGIRDCYDLLSLQGITWWEKPYQNKDLEQLLFQQKELNFQPGSRYLYSNSNYLLLASIIEKVTHQSFAEYTNSIFKKLGMPSTSFEDNALTIRGPIAKPYFNFGSWSTYDWIWNACGDGNLFSTLPDMIRWEAIVQGHIPSGIQAAVIKKSQLLPDATQKSYGYGLEFGIYQNKNYQFHEGATGAWKATFTRIPHEKIAFITVTNSGKVVPSMQTRLLMDAYFQVDPNQKPYPTKPGKAGAYVPDSLVSGTYLTNDQFAFRFENRNGSMFLLRSGRNDVELVRASNNVFYQKFDPDFQQEFLYNKDGNLEVTAYYPSHAPYTLTKVPFESGTLRFQAWNGTYSSDEISGVIEIQYESGMQFSVKYGQSKSNGLLIAANKMLVDNYLLELTTEGHLLLNGDRVRQLRYVKKP